MIGACVRATYTLAAALGRSHPCTQLFLFSSPRAPWVVRYRYLGVVGLSSAPPPFSYFTSSAEALPKFVQPPVVTRAREVVRVQARERESDTS